MTEPAALRLAFLGTPEFAVPALHALAESRHHVVGVISQPDRPRGRGRATAPTPVKAEALRHDLPVLQPDKVGDDAARAWLAAHRPDLGIVVAFGQFIPKKIRELPRLGMINAHASLLPRHRGAAPIQHAILSGDEKTGISVMRVVKEMDAGDVCLVRELTIGAHETAGELSARLARLAAEALLAAVEEIAAGRAEFVPQVHAAATFAPKVDRDFAKLDWRAPRAEVLRRLRAATPWPGVDVVLARSGQRLRVLEARPGEGPPAEPGRVRAGDGRLQVAAGDGWVDVLRVQRPGKRPAPAADYLRGARIPEDEAVEPS